MKPGDLVAWRERYPSPPLLRLERASKLTHYTHGVIVEIVEAPNDLFARILWQNGTQTVDPLRDFVHYYEVVNGEKD